MGLHAGQYTHHLSSREENRAAGLRHHPDPDQMGRRLEHDEPTPKVSQTEDASPANGEWPVAQIGGTVGHGCFLAIVRALPAWPAHPGSCWRRLADLTSQRSRVRNSRGRLS